VNTASTGTADVALVYGPISFAVVNSPPGDRLDISGLEFVSGDTMLPITAWDNEFLGVPLNNFSVGSCVQTWDFTNDEAGIPATCNLRAGVIHLPAANIFWVNSSFEVRWLGQTIVTCPPSGGSAATCTVLLF